MKIIEFLSYEFRGFKKNEKVFFTAVLFAVFVVSILKNDTPLALISSLCGISYTILAGKGKISCYFIGIAGTFCYVILALKGGFFGNASLYAFYYFPMQIAGILKWQKHLNKDTREVIKTELDFKNRLIFIFSSIALSAVLSLILYSTGGNRPVLDAFTVGLSVIGQILTVKRCIEQWYFWFFVNLISMTMWILAVINGSKTYATVLMWGVYLFLSIYFYIIWRKELKAQI